ncbi:MAG: tripartite tricarboxylate transporter substrate binding protein [Xanthobacteraceae bacterium]
MKRATIIVLGVAFLLSILTSAQAADTYPSRPIKLIVAFQPGGVADVMGRLVAQALQSRLNQSVVVENKPGGDGLIGMGDAVRAVPDGYTLLVGGFGGQIIPPLMRDDFPFDVRRDLVKIALTAEFGNVLVVNESLPVNSVPDLIAYLKARPGAVNFGSSGRATSDLLAAAMFMLQTGTKMVDVPYAGGGQALSDMMAGSTQVMFPQLPAVLGLINSGQVRALAVTSAGRLSQLPDVPTLSESGLPGFHVSSWNELFGPRGLPDDIRDLLSRTLVDAIRNDTELRAKMLKLGVEPIGEGAAQAEAFFNDELVRWKDVIDRAGLKIQP